MARQGKRGGWLRGLPKVTTNVITELTTTRSHSGDLTTGSWWLQRTPSTGLGRDARLLLKDGGGRVVSNWEVMRDGEAVSPFNSDGELLPRDEPDPSGRRARPDLAPRIGGPDYYRGRV